MCEYERWLAEATDGEIRAELMSVQGMDKEIEDRFYAPLVFGTAGLRGIMGMGLGCINQYTIRQATDAFARVILEEGEAFSSRGVCLCWDCRQALPPPSALWRCSAAR